MARVEGTLAWTYSKIQDLSYVVVNLFAMFTLINTNPIVG